MSAPPPSRGNSLARRCFRRTRRTRSLTMLATCVAVQPAKPSRALASSITAVDRLLKLHSIEQDPHAFNLRPIFKLFDGGPLTFVNSDHPTTRPELNAFVLSCLRGALQASDVQ